MLGLENDIEGLGRTLIWSAVEGVDTVGVLDAVVDAVVMMLAHFLLAMVASRS